MEHHQHLRLLFVCGSTTIFLVGGLGVENKENRHLGVPILLYVTLFFGLGKSGSLPDTTKNSLGIGRKNSTFFFLFC